MERAEATFNMDRSKPSALLDIWKIRLSESLKKKNLINFSKEEFNIMFNLMFMRD